MDDAIDPEPGPPTRPPPDHPPGSLRFRYKGKERVIVWDWPQWHPVGHVHDVDTGDHRQTHRAQASWCVPIFVHKVGMAHDFWAPRWLKVDHLSTLEGAMLTASNEYHHAVGQADAAFQRRLNALDRMKAEYEAEIGES